MTQKVAIIGAGITGVTTAYQLLERGYTVSVFDKNPPIIPPININSPL